MLLRNIFFMSRSTDPTDIILSNNEIVEDSVVGTTIGTLTTTDENINDTFTYTIETDVDDKFIIDGNALKLNDTLDYVDSDTHSVTIRSTDNKGRYYTKEFTINVIGIWKPTELSTKNIAWLDFVDTDIMTLNGGKIESMTTKSPTPRVFSQASAENRPTYGATGATFLRNFDFLVHEYDAVTQPNGVFCNVTGGFRIFATVINESESAGAEGVLITESNFTSNSRPFFNAICKVIDDGTLRNRIGAVYRSNTAGSIILTSTNTKSDVPSLSLTEYNLISMQDDLSTYRNFTNTVQSDETAYVRAGVTLTPTNRVTIGALLSSSGSGFGVTGGWIIKDILVTTNDLTTDELDRIDGYMAWSAGIQAKLPDGHPYKTDRPRRPIFTDTFTDANNTTIIAHTSDSGYAWVAQTGYAPTVHARIINNRLMPQSPLNVYRADFVMPSPNYEVETIFYVFTNTGLMGVNARASSIADTYYTWRYSGGIGWALQKWVNGALTILATFSQTLIMGQVVVAKIVCNGSTIQGYVDGVLRASATDTVITEAGSVGIRVPFAVTSTTGMHMDSIKATVL
jgi:hypothetical protein